jgi:hypothetical protein
MRGSLSLTSAAFLIDPGIDEGPTGEVYKLRLLGQGEIPTYLSKFTPISAPYDLVEQVEVTGR